ncbi:MAG: glycosyltransferase family 2 protein [Lachnospiraceae bacterium]|nr:glycosyltransferase family 2 protein [Lachnospiraceae bacterium]
MEDYSRTVSVIIPVYHLEKYIRQTMECVLAQTYTDWEMVLVEDGGNDRSAEIIEEFIKEKDLSGRIRLIHQKDEFGAAAARNTGVRESRGRYIAYLDGDDVWSENKLEKQLAFMKEKDAAFVFTGYEFADANAVGNGKVVRVPETLNYKQALRNTTIFTSTVMFDTRKLPREKLMMPKIKSEDTALWWRLLREGNIAYGLDENLVLYRRPGKSLSSNKLEAVRRIWMLYRKSEKLNIFASAVNFVFWAVRAVGRRI